MTDVPDGMVPWDMQTDSQQWEMVRGSGYYACEHMEKTDCGEWRHEDDHNAEVLQLRKQIYQLMKDVAEARGQRDQLYKITRRAVGVAELLDNMRNP